MVGERYAKLPGLARERLEGERDVAERPIARREAGVLPDALWAAPGGPDRAAGKAGPAEGKESTLVGLSIPRQRALSARNAASSARLRLTSPP